MVDQPTSIIAAFAMAAAEVCDVARPGQQLKSVLAELGVEAVSKPQMLGPAEPVKAAAMQATACRSKLSDGQSDLETLDACRPFSGKAVASPCGAGQSWERLRW